MQIAYIPQNWKYSWFSPDLGCRKCEFAGFPRTLGRALHISFTAGSITAESCKRSSLQPQTKEGISRSQVSLVTVDILETSFLVLPG